MRKILLFVVALGVGIIGWWGAPTQAATLSILPTLQTVVVGQHFIVEVHLDSDDETINAVGATISYDRELLQPVKITQDSSFLTLWAEVPTFNLGNGTITLTGGVPGGSIVVDGRVVSIEFVAIKSGSAWVTADKDSSQVLLNDGAGTAASLATTPASYQVMAGSASLLTVTSTTHPDELTWYAATTVSLVWEARTDAQYSYVLTTNTAETPDDRAEGSRGAATFTTMPDGAYTFVLSEKLPNDDWEVVARRPVLIDATAPLAFTPRLTEDVDPHGAVIVFATSDETAGIDHYQLVYGDTIVADATSPYRLLSPQARGTIVVRAYDRAGNVREGVLTIADTSTPYQPLAALALGGAAVLGVAWWLVRRFNQR